MSLETMSAAISRLEQAGYTGSFAAENSGVNCSICGTWHAAEDLAIDEIVRFEGESDPADEAVLFALQCSHCRARGTYVAAYGPSMEADDVAVVLSLLDHRRAFGDDVG